MTFNEKLQYIIKSLVNDKIDHDKKGNSLIILGTAWTYEAIERITEKHNTLQGAYNVFIQSVLAHATAEFNPDPIVDTSLEDMFDEFFIENPQYETEQWSGDMIRIQFIHFVKSKSK